MTDGQFTQEDPIGIAGGLNLYGYANGDPINFSDPFGLCPEEERDADGKCPEPEGGPHNVPLPDGKNGLPNSWVPKQPSGPEARPGWKPEHKVPSPKGGQPGASWDPKNGHWDVDWGLGGDRDRFSPDGTLVDHWNNPLRIGAAALGTAGAGYLIYRGIRLLPSLTPPFWPTLVPNLIIGDQQ